MNCPNDHVLRAYLDAELDASQIGGLKDHLSACAACEARSLITAGSAVQGERWAGPGRGGATGWSV